MRNVLIISVCWLGMLSCREPEQTMFFAEGNCEACGPLIEAALENVDGVASATWNYETSFATVQYHPDEVAESDLQQALAEAGFATGFYEPNAEARGELPACCLEPIDRKLEPANPLPPGH